MTITLNENTNELKSQIEITMYSKRNQEKLISQGPLKV